MLYNFLLAAEAAGDATTDTTGSGNSLSNAVVWIIFIVMIVGMILLTVIPNKKRQKEYQQMQNDLRVGTKIVTIGRMIGVITKIYDDNTIEVDVGTPGNPVIITITREAISQNLTAQAELKAKQEAAKKVEAKPVSEEGEVVNEEGEPVASEEAVEGETEEPKKEKRIDDAI